MGRGVWGWVFRVQRAGGHNQEGPCCIREGAKFCSRAARDTQGLAIEDVLPGAY